jgi:hypothetical protein
MSEETQEVPPVTEVTPKATADLSPEIIRQVEKQRYDRVTCRRVGGDGYRCNWWAPGDTAAYDNPAMAALTVTTHRVRRSRFLYVTRTAKGLLIQEQQPQ